MAKEAEWNKNFNIGVDSIDNAHRKLFSIVRKLINLSQNEHNGQWACAEGIKYFKRYAIEHFTDEEAYMQSIDYSGYKIHKRLHDDIKPFRLSKKIYQSQIILRNPSIIFSASALDG